MAKPKLRFPEFTDEWKEYRISEVFDRVANHVIVEKNKYYKQIGIRSHGKGLFYKEEVTGEELGNKRVFWVEPDCFVVNIVFAWERAVAKLTEAEREMIASHRFPMYKPKDQVLDLDYITKYFTTFFGQKILILASPGGAGRNKTLGQDEFLKSKIKLPSYMEQRKISNILFLIDGLIQVQEEEIFLLEEQKKGVIQKLFDREVRFKADDGNEYPEWEEKLIGDILKICHGKDYKHLSNGNIPVLGTGGVITFVNEYLCDWECVLIGRKGTIDKPQYMNTPFWSVDTLFYSKPERNQCVRFQYYLFETINWKVYDESTGVPSLSASTIEKISTLIPCLEEQQKIADCLSAYDEAVQIKKDKLEIWKEIKKGLLQQMFV